jgi:hypothetical protein
MERAFCLGCSFGVLARPLLALTCPLGLGVQAQKNDDGDAEGIAKTSRRPTMRFAELKS